MPQVVEHPPQPCGGRASSVVICHDRVAGTDPGGLKAIAKLVRRWQWMSPRAVRPREIRIKIEEDRTRDVARLVGQATAARGTHHPADVDDAQVGGSEALRQRFGRDDR